jgi:orotate phosphoribosyltransferase
MEAYKREFIDFMVSSEVLTFGDFVTKSGRETPYFVNTGRYRTGAQVAELGRFYAAAIDACLDPASVDVLFGPAYKGIPLVVTTAIALDREYDRNHAFCFNRKESKDHGEGGSLVGHAPADGERVLIVEDVTTAGTSIRETVPVLRAQADMVLAGLIVSVDRQEKGPGGGSALAEVGDEFGMPSFSIVTLDEIIEHLSGGGGEAKAEAEVLLTPEILERIEAYRDRYGAP